MEQTLSSIAMNGLVSGILQPSSNCVHLRPSRNIPQSDTPGKTQFIRLLSRHHAEIGQSRTVKARGKRLVWIINYLHSQTQQYRYHEISRCMRQWRHLKGIKQGGGAHRAHPLSTTPSGSFAIKCPACPHPGRNLPDDWDSVCSANE